MMVTRFRLDSDLIVVHGWIVKRSHPLVVRLAVDTAASETLIKPRVLARIGYGPEHFERRTVIRSAVGAERGFLLRVERLEALGFAVTNHVVHAHELPEQYDIDGLLGLRFLKLFDYTVYSRRGEIAVELAAPPRLASPTG